MISRRHLLLAPAALPLFHIMSRAETLLPKGGDQTKSLQLAIDVAGNNGGVVQLGAGTFEVSTLTINGNTSIIGIPGATKLVSKIGEDVFAMRRAKKVVLQGITVLAKSEKGNLIAAEGIERLVIEDCDLSGGRAAIRASACGGRIVGNRIRFGRDVGVLSIAGTGMEISGNDVSDMGNLGIQILRYEKGDNPTIVSNNFVSRIAAIDGDDGPNGNGINTYQSHGVIISNNIIKDCAFTGIRNASSDASTITGNQISRCNEVALYVEFEFSGAVVSNNIIDTAAHGISITNFREGGRLAQCTGNVVRNIKGVDAHGEPLGGGINTEADTVIANNVVENAQVYGIRMGWGPYARNLSATGNILKDCAQGIRFSAVGPGPFLIANNLISGAKNGAILGMDHDKPVTSDLAVTGAKIPDMAQISGNIAKS
jgi:uncharacterized secreted repeat protein (TIGR03808 family)